MTSTASRVLTAAALWRPLVLTALAFAAFIALDQFVFQTRVLTDYKGLEPLSPLYAFWMPAVRPAAVVFVILTAACVYLLPRLVSEHVSTPVFGASLLLLSLALPLTLFLVRDDVTDLGSQFLIYPREEYFDDARRISDLAEFIRHYTEIAPQLSLHGRVHPPGFAALLYIVGHMISPSPLAAGVGVLFVFAAGIVVAWRVFAVVLDARAARIAAMSLLAAPSLLDFACTSMDSVFFTSACVVLWTAFLSFSHHGRWWHGVLTGLSLYVAMFCSFSAIPMFLFVLVYATLLWWNDRSRGLPLQLAFAGGGFVAAYLIVRYGVGFDMLESFQVARSQHYKIMGNVLGRSVTSAYLPTTLGNVAAFMIGTGLTIVPLFLRGLRNVPSSSSARTLAVATGATIGLICAAGLYTMETERILMFAMPWLSLSAAAAATQSDSAVRMMMGAGWLQAIAMETLLFTLW